MYHLFLGNTAATLMLAVTAIVVSRILGPDGYGLYTIALIIPPFLFNAIRLGLDTAATRYGSRLKSEGKEKEATEFAYAMVIIEVGLAVVFTTLFLTMSGILASRVLNRPEIAGVILPISTLSVIGQAAYTVSNSGLVGLGKFDKAALFQALQGVTKLVVSVGLVVLGFGVAGAVAGYTASFFVSGVLGALILAGMSGGSIPRGLKNDLATGAIYGWPVYLSVLASGFVAPVVTTVLALTVSNTQIGGYSTAATFSSLITLFTYPISAALFPLFSRKVDDNATLGGTYRTAVRFTGLLVTPVASFIVAFSSPLMVSFYGRAYAFGTPYLALFAAIYLLAGVGSLAWSALLYGTGHTRDVLVTTALGSAVSVGSAIALMQLIGVAGAVAGQLLGSGVSLGIGTSMVRRRLGVGLALASGWKIYASAAIAAVVCYPLTWLIGIPQVSLVVGAVVYVMVFIPLLAVLRTMDTTSIQALREYLGFSKVVSRPLEMAISYYDYFSRTRGTDSH